MGKENQSQKKEQAIRRKITPLSGASIAIIACLLTLAAEHIYFTHTVILNGHFDSSLDMEFDKQFDIYYSLDTKQNDLHIVDVINNADHYVYFAIYEFTKANIANALITAKERGLAVAGITDRSNYATDSLQKTLIDRMRAAGIPIETQKHPQGIMHIKAIVTDKSYALGSYNWTSAATTQNDELLEISTDDGLRRQYLAVLKKILLINQ
jgi:phosphatidylserine/phosphatidylglycerophosphate/cardiolipin synthase-like enzyme